MMRLVLAAGAVSALLVAVPTLAGAQEIESKPPFYEADTGKDEDKTAFSGNITSSTFYFSESGGAPPAVMVPPQLPQNASFMDRAFTELRLKLRADHIRGAKLDFRGDLRFRKQLESCDPRLGKDALGNDIVEPCLPAQSGLFGEDERDVRELYLRPCSRPGGPPRSGRPGLQTVRRNRPLS